MNQKENKPHFGFMTRNYLVLTLTSTLWGIPTSICNTYFSLYVFGLGGTEITIGLIAALGSTTFVISAIIGGHIADLYGRKTLISLMTIALGLSQFLVAFAPNWQFLTLAIILANVCWIFEPAFWAILADSINEQKRGTAFAFYSCLSFLPWAIMPSIGGYLIDIHGIITPMRWAYVGLAIVGVTAGIIRMFMLTETISPQNKQADEQYSVKELGKLVKDAFKEHLQTWSWMPHSTLALTAIYILWAFEYGLVEPYWIVYAEEIIGLTSTQWGIIIGVGSAISITSKILIVGKLLDKFSRRKILLATTALDIFTYLLFIRCGMFIQVLALWTASSFIWSFYEPTYSSLEADLIPKERRGRVFAAFGVAWSTFSVPASLLGGFIYEQVSPELSFIMASVGITLCFILTALFIKQPQRNKK
ncbi:MAG: MFS transporter [Candidatus Bathyarchaeota archaeon]|nr:MFS transporter [Candidatus Bathyarchaeota archaeon]MDH5494341.1 MFS transporter [Candidatus Bathyarchaeota archaeon]